MSLWPERPVSPRHPERDELLALIDGEVSAARARRLARHLEGCWQCRAVRERLEADIRGLMTLRALPPPADWIPLEQSRLDFRRRLRQASPPAPWSVLDAVRRVARHYIPVAAGVVSIALLLWATESRAAAHALLVRAISLLVGTDRSPHEGPPVPAPVAVDVREPLSRPRAAIAADVARPAPEVEPPPPARVVRPRTTPRTWRDTVATPLEVQVARALRALDADLGEEVYVVPMSDGGVSIQGLVDDEARLRALVEGLAAHAPGARADVQTFAQARRAAPFDPSTGDERRLAPLRADLPAPALPSLTPTLPAVARIRDLVLSPPYGGAPVPPEQTARTVSLFIAGLLDDSDQCLYHAWSLRRLAEEFDARRIARLAPPLRTAVDELREEHRAEIRRRAFALRARLVQLRPPGAPPLPPLDAVAANDVDRIALVEEQNAVLRRYLLVEASPTAAFAALNDVIGRLRALE